MSEEVICVENLVKKYKPVIAVHDVSFTVNKGEIFSLVGPNGAGKTTTVEILECLRAPTSGKASVLGYDVTREEDEIKKRIGVMPQDFNAFERLTVRENVELIASIYQVNPDLRSVLEELGMWEARDRHFESLSGGMKRRVGICMALINDPVLLFLDEPTTGLDPQARKETWEVIRRLKSMGKTVVLTSHYMEEVEQLSDRAAVMFGGEIIAQGSIDELISAYGGGIRIRVSPCNEEIETILMETAQRVITEDSAMEGVFQERTQVAKTLAALYQLDEKYRLDIVEPSMDNVFSRLAGGRVDERGELI
ncbi:MAG: ABC transporter ATP-binding protein [Theionarchaea archaeon]|nr:ABC transporter ATP-binding protein [Theionarchaea archaeon]MBU6999492.1 ABC transporter ATP-binding protein [Theionarchaea archaeon]MBU7021738.1 ABC transporter ATP-binding protein [Theionarchaea archaeon]MBU7034521.1 ABC transporter ATP-binding protein [Theionarchaea archaeon]MBU7041008.1 ABC transporter ATP-binding protein [Theionarchaea archaeon]